MTVPFDPIRPPGSDSTSPLSRTRPRVLILGGNGMLGHKLWQAARDRFDTWVTVRDASQLTRHPPLTSPDRIVDRVDAERPETVENAVSRIAPDVIVNAIGLIKQRDESQDPVRAIRVNALLPHVVARAAAARGARFIQISTDCVFSGASGAYRETDTPDAADLYGRSKLLGEVDAPGTLTLRTSMIGRELSRDTGLLEWFLSRRNRDAAGFTRAIFSGLTTPVLASLIVEVIERHPRLTGLYHVAADPIDKHRLLVLLNAAFGANVTLRTSETPRIDRSLDGSRFREVTGLVAPTWEAMIDGLANDPTPYDQWRLSA